MPSRLLHFAPWLPWILFWHVGCSPTPPQGSYVCNSAHAAEWVYADYGAPGDRCTRIDNDALSGPSLRRLGESHKLLVYDDGVSPIRVFSLNPYTDPPDLAPIGGHSVSVDCGDCEDGWRVGIYSGGAYQWCTWDGKACSFDQLFPGRHTVVVREPTGRLLSTQSCMVGAGEVASCTISATI